jgi:KUP system potassium uptake protein
VPITIAILVALFMLQRRGTAGIGRLFGPVMIVWFLTLAVLGAIWVIREPSVLTAVNPAHAVRFFLANRLSGFLVLGSVFLVVTGGETIYADMGHFGRRPIRIAWFTLVLPSLLLNYFGQGAVLITHPDASANPFFEVARRLASPWVLYYMVVLATMATIIASQAVISGAFSLTRQAVQLGYIPRIEIVHTSGQAIGQIYIPSVNWFLMISACGLVLGFQKSTNLAAAYGVAVTTTMVITTLLAYVVARRLWGWNPWLVTPVAVFFLIVESSFFGANIIKIWDGGWLPLTVGALIYTLLATWKKGRQILGERLAKDALPMEQFVANVQPDSPPRVPGTAIFLSRDPRGTPTALLHNLKHNMVLHEHNIVMNVRTAPIPRVDDEERLQLEGLSPDFSRMILTYGYMETPNIPKALLLARRLGLKFDIMKTSFFVGRRTIKPTAKSGMPGWQENLFLSIARQASNASDFYKIPSGRVVELGTQVTL